MLEDKQKILSSGKALENPEDDKLGYTKFAKMLAEGIERMMPPDGLVIAVYGSWGSGKTTMLNFVKFYVQQIAEENRPIIVQFNPWWFSGTEDLTLHFFTELNLILGKSPGFSGQLLSSLADLAETVSRPTPYAVVGNLMAFGLRAAAGQKKDVVEIKDEIKAALKAQKKKIVILIDDIDRLTAEEIRQLFRVIKAVADFPNVVYLLAFDKKVAIKALEQMQGLNGEDYLEKIVQAPFELPTPDKNALRAMLYEQLNVILSQDTSGPPIDPVYWGNLYYVGIDHFIANPRHIVRLANTLRVTFPAVKGEVNPSDFIAIETLRVFCPLAYDVVRKNADEFTGHSVRVGGPVGKESFRNFHESWMKDIQEEDRATVKNLLAKLFPRFQSAWDNTNYPDEWERRWRKELRVCSQATFPVYFRFGLPEGEVSLSEVRAVLSVASDHDAFNSNLLNLAVQKRPDGKTRVSALLDRLADCPEEFKLESISTVIQVLFEIGDRLLLPEDDSHDIFGLRNYMRISRLARYLLRRLDEKQRYAILKESMEMGHSVATIVDFVIVLELEYGKRNAQSIPEDERLVTSEHLSELETIALNKIREVASEGKLEHAPRLGMILAYWRESKADEVRAWTARIATNKDSLASLIEESFLEGYRQSISDKVGEVTYQLDPSLHEILDSEEAITRVRELLASGRWTGEKKHAVEHFLSQPKESERAKA